MANSRPLVVRLLLRRDTPAALFAIALLAAMAEVQPSVLTQTGLSLTFLGIVPIAFATVAQMIIMVGGDIDLSIGSALGLVNVICATYLNTNPVLGVLALVAFALGYMAMGALIELRRLPSLLVTFAFSFVWLGFALIVLPTPGGVIPSWMTNLFTYSPPGIPGPVLILVIIAAASWFFMMKTRPGRLIRAFGNRRLSAQQYTRRPLNVRLTMYGCAALVIILGGFSLSAQTGSGDPQSGQSFILASVAAVILGGGEFAGGSVWPVGAVLGATGLGLVSAIDSYFNLSSNLIIGIEGLILIVAVGLRRGLEWLESISFSPRTLAAPPVTSEPAAAPAAAGEPDGLSRTPSLRRARKGD